MYQQHPLSAAFPAMNAEDFQALKDSIDNIGVQNPITIFEGMVVDGWNRYKAANELGMECPAAELGDVDPRDFVLAQNKARRHVTQAQLAMATTSVYAWKPEGNPAFTQLNTQCPVGKSTAELAEIAGVHPNTIKQAKTVQTSGTSEVQAAVKSGAIGLPKAAAIAKLPQEEQAAAISKPAPKKPAKAKPAPVVEPEIEAPTDYTELDAARDEASELRIEIDRLRAANAVMHMDGTAEEKQLAAALLEEKDAELQALRATNKALVLSRDSLMEENAQMKVQMAMQRREIERLKSTK